MPRTLFSPSRTNPESRLDSLDLQEATLTTLEEQYEELADEALLEILAEGPEHYRAEALAAAREEAESRGLDLGQVARFDPSARRPSRLRSFFGFYLICGGYGTVVGLPLLFSQLAKAEGPPVLLDFFAPVVVIVIGVSFFYLGSRLVSSWRLCVFWSAVASSVVWVAGVILTPSTDPGRPSTVAVAISVAINLLFIVLLRRHAWRGSAGSA